MTNKKLFVPEHVARAAAKDKKVSSELPNPLETAFGKKKEKSKNESDPSNLEPSALERLPQPTGAWFIAAQYSQFLFVYKRWNKKDFGHDFLNYHSRLRTSYVLVVDNANHSHLH